MKSNTKSEIPIWIQAIILSKYYFGVLTKRLDNLDVDRYFSVLQFLHENNGCSQQYICNHLAIDKTAMVKVMDYLIKAGYITRKINSKDRREHFILLTKKGFKRTTEVVNAFREIDNEILSKISKKDKDCFVKILNVLVESLQSLPAHDLFFNYQAKKRKESAKKSASAVKTSKK